VIELNAELSAAVPATEGNDAVKRGFVLVRVKPKIGLAQSALRVDRCRLGEQQAARYRQMTEMHHIPFGRAAVVAGILPHRRRHDAVAVPDRAS
jgi:hypothetical protein